MLAPALKEQWDRDGWCIVPQLIPAGELEAAQHAMHRYFPTPAEMAERGGAAAGEWHTWDAAWPEFPFHSSRLNALVLHDRIVGLAEGLLGTSDLALYMGIVTAKYAAQASGYNQLLHADYPNHMLVVPRHAPGFQQAEFFVYLTDVTTEDGATRFVSWQKTRDIPVERHTLHFADYPELYDDPSDAAAPAGSVVAYRPDVYHRSTDFTDPARYRVMLHVSFRHRDASWAVTRPGRFEGSRPSSRSTSSRPRRGSSRSWACPSRAIPTGTRPCWPASKPATRPSTWIPGGTRCADQ